MQKQAFQFELNETENALKEVKDAEGDILKLTGQIMLKASKDDVEKDLSHKQEILKLRTKSIEKQESNFKEEAEKVREEVMKKLK